MALERETGSGSGQRVSGDLIRPRIFAVPKAHASLAEQGLAFARRNGIGLDPEQELVFAASLGVRADGRWQSKDVAVNAPRQNGKGEILMARELFGNYELGEMFNAHTSHEFKTSEKHFARVERAVRNSPELLDRVKRANSGRIIGFRYSHGDEAIELESGARTEFRTRTKAGMRGFDDVALLVLDEAMILPADAASTMIPVVRASTAERGPQIWYAGSAADQNVHEHAVVWARVRERGLAGDDPELTYAEWSLDFASPEDVPDDVMSDPKFWRLVNWAIERGRVTEDHMAWEMRSMASRRGFIVELLGVGDYPSTAGVEHVLDPEKWSACFEEKLDLADPVAFGFDVTPARSSGAVAASDGTGLEVVDHRRGTGWIVPRLVELKAKHRPLGFFCAAGSPAESLVPECEQAGLEVTVLTAKEHALACGMLFDAVEQGRLRHGVDTELDEAVAGAVRRELGEAWAWSRRNSAVNIAPLCAVTFALYGSLTTERKRLEPMVSFA